MLSGKGGGLPKTDRRLAQKQPSFKESVIAHCSTCIGRQSEHSTETGGFRAQHEGFKTLTLPFPLKRVRG